MFLSERMAATRARLASFNAGLPQFRLGIAATLSIAFLAVAGLAAAANLISERGLRIIQTVNTSPAPPTIVRRPTQAPVEEAPEIPVPRFVSAEPVLAAAARFEQAAQSRSITQSEGADIEVQNATFELQRATNELLSNVADRTEPRDRRKVNAGREEYEKTGAGLIRTADAQRSTLAEYSARYESMHARARATMEGAWKVFGRVVARQALVTLSTQIEDMGRRSAALTGRNGDMATVAASVAGSERAIAATLADNERSLVGSQGKEWVAAMNEDLAWLAASREKVLQMEQELGATRDRLMELRGSLETRSRSIAKLPAQSGSKVKAAAAAATSTSAATVAAADTPTVAVRSQRGHHSPRFGRPAVVATGIDPGESARKSVIAWISAAVLLLLVFISVATVRSVVGPVRRLVRATTRLAQGDLEARVTSGGIKELDTLAVAFNDMAGKLSDAERITRDYQAELEAKVAERTEQLKLLASVDPLTALPNRRELFVLLDEALVQAKAKDACVGVFFLDVDNFKNINDGLGHAFGDQVLRATALRLQQAAAKFGFAARLGGDEFTLVMTEARTIDEVRDVGLQLVKAFTQPLTVDTRELVLSVSIGASVFPLHERTSDALLRAADAALFRAKALGRSQLTMYSPELLTTAAAKFAIEQGLRRALDKGEFELVFQPELNLASMQVELVEALIRWRQPDGRLASPGEFLAVAEESGLIMEMSDWVLRTAISAAARWHHGSWPDARIAINVSSRQLIDATFVERVQNLLKEYRLPPRCIEIELTESVLQTGPATLAALRQIRSCGIAIALDDFGTGYSSLASLQQLPLTRIKLDRSLLEDIDTSPRSLSIARSIMSLCRSLGLEITAEGIERAEQLSLLLADGAMFVQGYLLSRPIAEGEVIPSLAAVAERSRSLLLPSATAAATHEKVAGDTGRVIAFQRQG